MLESSTADERNAAAKALGSIGSDSKEAVPELVSVFNTDPDVQANAATALGQIGSTEAVPSLAAALASQDNSTRGQAARALGAIGADAKATVPALVELLQSPNVNDRYNAANAIGELGSAAEEAVPALIPFLQDDSLWIESADGKGGQPGQFFVAGALQSIGPVAAEATDALEEQLQTAVSSSMRRQAALALLRVDPSLSVLLDNLNSENIDASVASAEALSLADPSSQAVIDALRAVLENPQFDTPEANLSLQRSAAIALTMLGQEIRPTDFDEKFQTEYAVFYRKWKNCPRRPTEVDWQKPVSQESRRFYNPFTNVCEAPDQGGLFEKIGQYFFR